MKICPPSQLTGVVDGKFRSAPNTVKVPMKLPPRVAVVPAPLLLAVPFNTPLGKGIVVSVPENVAMLLVMASRPSNDQFEPTFGAWPLSNCASGSAGFVHVGGPGSRYAIPLFPSAVPAPKFGTIVLEVTRRSFAVGLNAPAK